MSKYKKVQQAACLSNLSNLLFKAKRPLPELNELLEMGCLAVLKHDKIKELIGDWEIVWGPVVYSAKPDNIAIPDNVCFMVKTQQYGNTTYCIATAGTNSKSLKENICKQDLKVRPKDMIEWNIYTDNTSNHGKIAKGTNIALNIILNSLIDPSKGSLKDFLISHKFEQGSEIITAGHSLGAAISVILAVWLADNKQTWGGQDSIISTYPTAGPTVGNKDFTDHAMNTLNNNFFGYYNSLDAVARAWDKIVTVKEIYINSGLKPKLAVKVGIKGLEKLVSKNNPYYRCPGWKCFEGTFNPNAPGKPLTPFMNQIMYQHLAAYIEPLGYKEYYELAQQIFPLPIDKR